MTCPNAEEARTSCFGMLSGSPEEEPFLLQFGPESMAPSKRERRTKGE